MSSAASPLQSSHNLIIYKTPSGTTLTPSPPPPYTFITTTLLHHPHTPYVSSTSAEPPRHSFRCSYTIHITLHHLHVPFHHLHFPSIKIGKKKTLEITRH
ncbi:hypothetical protein E2C01_083531 [Portunus trituberculatus]|uniref:Uncharacterized protein n=1 Tax=Portunus trituberculatus TaxID=210409 RepID=A0A5B7J3R9_PORTR|nr:hypothetical protein [Portunus trituberculatus]